MSKVKRLVAAVVCAALFVTPTLAAETEKKFSAVNTYAGFADVAESDWFYATAKLCYEVGLLNGTGNGFEPNKTLTTGEAAAIAARIREGLSGETIVRSTPAPGETRAWYQDYVDYLYRMIETYGGGFSYAADLLSRPEEPVSREGFLFILGLAVSQDHDYLPAINAIETLPDANDSSVLWFYNAGILTGVDEYGTFNAMGTLTRAECAAMVARVVEPTLRQRFTPKELPKPEEKPQEKPALSYEEELMQTEAVRVNGVSVPFEQFIDTMNGVVYATDSSLKSRTGKGLDWNAKYSGIDDLPAYFKSMAMSQVVEDTLVAAQTRALGCKEEELPAKLTPDPSKELDKIYCAKHILVEDEETANAILATLRANPSTALFDRLLAQYGTDPGMVSSPEGYLFTDGDMVSEFENAVKALKTGACSTFPVKSQFGYHIILRLDPTTYPNWEKEWQERRYSDYIDGWMAAATVTPNTVEINKLDVQARYEAFLDSLNS